MELEVQKSKKLEEGKYIGVITGVDYREVEYKGEKITYADVCIEEKDTKIVLRYGCSAYISEKSRLGKLLSHFVEVKEGTKIIPEEVLTGKQVSFMVMNEEGEKGSFVKVVEHSVKPLTVEGNNFTSEDNIEGK